MARYTEDTTTPMASFPPNVVAAETPVQPLLCSVVEKGQVWERVCKTKKFAVQVISTAFACGGVHVLVGWLTFTGWGKHAFASDATVCAAWKAHAPNVALDTEVFIDTLMTAFFVSGGQLPQRIKDVQFGRLPRVAHNAFPRGRLLSCLFPRCTARPTRQNHAANIGAWFGLSFCWMLVWGSFTFVVVFVFWSSPVVGGGQYQLCMPPWTYIAVRAVWTSIQGMLVCAGSYIAWCTRGERPSKAAVLPSNRQPLSPISPMLSPSFVDAN